MLLTKTVLFIGFSFTDEYLNELRSEVLAYLAPEGKTPRFAYALLSDVPPAMRTHFRDHEAMHVFDMDAYHLETEECGNIDADWRGAYGAQTRWLSRWIREHEDAVAAEDMALARDKLGDSCARIADTSGFAPCEGFVPGCAAGLTTP